MTILAFPNRARYSDVAIFLHWLIAVLIGAMLVMGLAMVHGGLPLFLVFKLYQWHKSVGITVLLLAVLRLAWRIGHRPPALPAAMPAIEKRAAGSVHLLLYAAMLGLPLIGWALVSASPLNIPTVLYGVLPWPHLPIFSTPADKKSAEAVLKLLHAYGAYALIALVALHAAAALRHHFVLHDDILRRMLPGRAEEKRRRGPIERMP